MVRTQEGNHSQAALKHSTQQEERQTLVLAKILTTQLVRSPLRQLQARQEQDQEQDQTMGVVVATAERC